MYLDTLKVSTLEQSASQATANGGKGNPDLITWDFGKEISLSLEDALFTPASQSLMWGGKFGVKKPKVEGLWNPYIYPKDEYGRTQYLRRVQLTATTDNNGLITLTNPDGETVATYPTDRSPLRMKVNGTVIYKYVNSQSVEYDMSYNPRTVSYNLFNYTFGYSYPDQAFLSWLQYFENAYGGNGNFYDENNNIIDISQEEIGRIIPMVRTASSLVPQAGRDRVWLLLNNYNIPVQIVTTPPIDIDGLEGAEDAIVVSFVCPCDGDIKVMQYQPNVGEWKYEDITDWAVGYKCPKGYDTGERATEEDTEANLVKTYYWNVGGDESIISQLQQAEADHPTTFKGRPERAEIIVDNYGQFDFKLFDMQVLNGEIDGTVITLDDQGSTQFCIYTPIKSCDQIVGDQTTACGSDVKAYGYEWQKVDMKMTSLEGDQDMYYLENANLRYRVPRNSTQKEIMIARQGLYETVAAVSDDDLATMATYEQATAKGYEWKKANDNEIVTTTDLTRQYTEYQSYGYFVNPYDSSIDFYLNVRLTVPQTDTNNSIEHTLRILLGRFFIVADWNFGKETAYDMIYPIESGMEDVKVLERMEKCKATRTFAIDANKNLAMNNYRNMEQYSNSALTVFIDPKTMKPYEPNSGTFTRANGDVITGNLRIIKQYEVYYKWTRTIAPLYTTLGNRIIVDAEHFPGTYRIVGETYARSRADGKDQRYQFEIPLAKLSAETNLTLTADGEPTTFSMNFKVMRRNDGVMVKLTQYNVDCNYYDGYASGSTKVVPSDSTDIEIDSIRETQTSAALRIVSPLNQTREFETNTDLNVEENIRAQMDFTTTATTTTFSTTTLEELNTNTVVVNTSAALQPDDFTAVVENEQEVGE